MKPDDIDYMSRLLRQESGLIINADKAYLYESRLIPVMRKYQLATLDDLVARLRKQLDKSLLYDVTQAMTTNETYFFRDQKPFDQFRQFIMPKMLEQNKHFRTLRIWSAAAASGQEAYSIAMILKEFPVLKTNDWQISIIATDLSSDMVERGKKGIYSQFEVQRGLPITLLTKYFTKLDQDWQINSELRDMVRFEVFNLMNDPKSFGFFDVIFCRNVLIYFDSELREQIMGKLHQVMNRDGILLLGGTESILGITNQFESLIEDRSLFRPVINKKV